MMRAMLARAIMRIGHCDRVRVIEKGPRNGRAPRGKNKMTV